MRDGALMAIITIENKHGVMRVHEGVKLPRARLEWRASGLEIYLKGAFSKGYDTAANLAMNYALSIHIPASSLRRQK